jgi:glucokinase
VSAVLAIDIGGTKLAAALVDPDGTVRRDERVPTGAQPWPDLVALLERVRSGEDIVGVGVSCGGPMRWPEGWIAPLNTPAWRQGFGLGEALRRQYDGLPVRVHNDVVALAVGEHWKGAARGVDDVLGMVVSTGVGGGIISGGRVLDGRTGNGGHVGHVVVEPDGPACGCGGHGCLEAVARGPAIVAWAVERGSRARDGAELAEQAGAGDDIALAALARAGRALGVGIASATALLDLRLVVIGGGMSQAGEPLWGALRESLAQHARLPFQEGLQVVPTALGQQSGLVGAGALLHQGDRYWSAG